MSFPQTEPPPAFVGEIIPIFQSHETEIATIELQKGLTSDGVLTIIRNDLRAIGFEVELGKRKDQKIERPVFFGENGHPVVRYQIDAYHPAWKCALEVEAGRAWMGNAVYRDLIQASIMVSVDYLVLAVPLSYKYFTSGRKAVSSDYSNMCGLASALYGHTRLRLPYSLVVIGY